MGFVSGVVCILHSQMSNDRNGFRCQRSWFAVYISFVGFIICCFHFSKCCCAAAQFVGDDGYHPVCYPKGSLDDGSWRLFDPRLTVWMTSHEYPESMIDCEMFYCVPSSRIRWFDDIDVDAVVRIISDELARAGVTSDFYDSYSMVRPMAYRADMFRAGILWLCGGLYKDSSLQLMQAFENFIDINAEHAFMLPKIDETASFENIGSKNISYRFEISMVYATRRHILLVYVIRRQIWNIRRRYYGVTGWCVTGPICWLQAINSYTGHLKSYHPLQIATASTGSVVVAGRDGVTRAELSTPRMFVITPGSSIFNANGTVSIVTPNTPFAVRLVAVINRDFRLKLKTLGNYNLWHRHHLIYCDDIPVHSNPLSWGDLHLFWPGYHDPCQQHISTITNTSSIDYDNAPMKTYEYSAGDNSLLSRRFHIGGDIEFYSRGRFIAATQMPDMVPLNTFNSIVIEQFVDTIRATRGYVFEFEAPSIY